MPAAYLYFLSLDKVLRKEYKFRRILRFELEIEQLSLAIPVLTVRYRCRRQHVDSNFHERTLQNPAFRKLPAQSKQLIQQATFISSRER